jgi:Zn-dependent protease
LQLPNRMETTIRSWKLGRAFGIDLFVHWSFLLIPALAFYSQLDQGASAAIAGASVVFALFGCVLLHELGHALMARTFGIGTRDITLYPIGGVARLEGIPEKPFAEMAIAVAGPLVNVVIAAGLWLGFHLAGRSFSVDTFAYGSLADGFLLQLFVLNIWLVIFNMIPAFPMDGGRVLRAALALFVDRLTATEAAVIISRLLAVGFIVWAAVSGSPMLAVIALFVFLAGAQELAFARRQHFQRAAERQYTRTMQPAERFVTVDAGAPPGWSGFTWDAQAGVWIQWRNGQPIGAMSGGPPR